METLKYLSQIFIIFGTLFSAIMWINWHVRMILAKRPEQQVVNWGTILALFLTMGYMVFWLWK
jgi:uncharacterized membrane protein